MKKKFNKTISVILIISFSLSLITIVYANSQLKFVPSVINTKLITNPDRITKTLHDAETTANNSLQDNSAEILENNIENRPSTIVSPPSDLGKSAERLPTDNSSIKFKNRSTEYSSPTVENSYSRGNSSRRTMQSMQSQKSKGAVNVIGGHEEEYYARRAEKLKLLSAAYPNEYEVIKSKVTDEYIHVNLLELIDCWIIDDINLFVDTYNAEGSRGLQKYFVSERNISDRVLK